MGAEDGCEHAKLDPTQHEIGIVDELLVGEHVSAEVVTPVAIAHVRCGGGEVRLKAESLVADVGIA